VGKHAVTTPDHTAASLAREVVDALGGRYSTELGIDVEAGSAEIERWFLAATLFGTRISTEIAQRAFRELDAAGISRATDAVDRGWDELVELLDAAGYARYDFRTASRLQELGRVVAEQYHGAVGEVGRRFTEPATLTSALDELPGWGPVTVGLFLRELRGVWPGADLPLDARASDSGRHLGLLPEANGDDLARLRAVARDASLDTRDLEAALVRLALRHRRLTSCPGGRGCIVLASASDRTGRRQERESPRRGSRRVHDPGE
jgi:hypothetical protein